MYIVEVSVTVFGKNPEFFEILTIIYEFMCERTLKEFPKLKDFEENPYLAEDFFGMMSRFMKYAPQIALLSKTLQISLNLAEIGIGVEHVEVAKTLYMFLENLMKLCREDNENFTNNHKVILYIKN